MADETTPIWPPDEPTNPRGARPSGPPPSGPPPAQPPTALPGWPSAGQPPQAQPGFPPQGPPPPYGPPPGFGGPGGPGGFGPPPPRKRRLGLIIAGALSLVLVIALAVTGWLYFTGRFGVGPLSAADKEAASAIVDGVEKPAWASDDDVECAVDEVVHEHRSGGLEERGVVDKRGDDWKYTGEWRADDANAYYESLLDCSDDWARAVGEEWGLEDTDCLDDIGSDTIGAFFAAETLTLSTGEDTAEKDRTKAVEELDECYLQQPEAPQATATPGYRSVDFEFAPADATGPGEAVLSTGGTGDWTPLSGTTASVETDQGGARGCVQAQAATTYPWGSTATAEAEICGTARPKRVFWVRPKAKCTAEPGCYSFELHYEGFKDFASITARYTSNGGNCLATSGSCADTITAAPGGKGTIVTWSFPGSYRGNFVARVGKLSDKVPN